MLKKTRPARPRKVAKKRPSAPELEVDTPWQGMPSDGVHDYEGFVYLIVNKTNGRKYIGRKYFWSKRKVKPKNAKRRKRVTKDGNWRTYKSSSPELLKDIVELGVSNFDFVVLHLCKTRGQTNYLEVKEQFSRSVLEAKLPSGEWEYYNGNVMSRYFKPTESGEKYENKCAAISEALKAGFANGSIVHGLKGKPHPNRGKKLPQTGHSLCKGRIWWNNGTESVFMPAKEPPPDGYVRGVLWKGNSGKTQKENFAAKYYKNQRACKRCGRMLEYEKRNHKFCSPDCQNATQSEFMADRFANGLNPGKKWTYETPKGSFETLDSAGMAFGVTGASISNWIKANKDGFFRVPK